MKGAAHEDCPVNPETGELLPVVTIVTDNGGPFRSFRFEAFIELHPELAHVRTRVRSPGQNGSRERGFGTLKYERLYIDEIDDAVMLAKHAEEYRMEYNQIRPHEAIAWNRPQEVHLGLASPTVPTFQTTENLPTPPRGTPAYWNGVRPSKPGSAPLKDSSPHACLAAGYGSLSTRRSVSMIKVDLVSSSY